MNKKRNPINQKDGGRIQSSTAVKNDGYVEKRSFASRALAGYKNW